MRAKGRISTVCDSFYTHYYTTCLIAYRIKGVSNQARLAAFAGKVHLCYFISLQLSAIMCMYMQFIHFLLSI